MVQESLHGSKHLRLLTNDHSSSVPAKPGQRACIVVCLHAASDHSKWNNAVWHAARVSCLFCSEEEVDVRIASMMPFHPDGIVLHSSACGIPHTSPPFPFSPPHATASAACLPEP